jgi:hypothetical protein
VAIINESYDIDGVAPVEGTTVPGVKRTLRAAATTAGSVTAGSVTAQGTSR